MPKQTIVKKVAAKVAAAVKPKVQVVKTESTPAPQFKCDNCNDSGMTCSVCRTGYVQ